ncbi:hypothetical protein, partial [uncultured Ruminococcus sp.]|uniref:hypothetical protein n=1 Tax=uncultured Ruminococcus sp. TaxID=165186 RepID=UPI00292D52BD
MSVMFSKVTLTADNGNTATLLCSGSPKDHYDLEDWTIYQKFMSDKSRLLPKLRPLLPIILSHQLFRMNRQLPQLLPSQANPLSRTTESPLSSISPFTRTAVLPTRSLRSLPPRTSP